MCRSNQVSVTRPGHAMLPALRNRSWFTKSHLNRLFTVPCCYERLMRISAKSVYLNQAYSLKTTGKASQPPPSRSWAPIIGDREQSNHISSKTLNGLNVWTISRWIMIIRVCVVLEFTVVDSHWYFDNLYVLWLLEWPLHRLPKRHSLSTTVLFRIRLSQKTIFYILITCQLSIMHISYIGRQWSQATQLLVGLEANQGDCEMRWKIRPRLGGNFTRPQGQVLFNKKSTPVVHPLYLHRIPFVIIYDGCTLSSWRSNC